MMEDKDLEDDNAVISSGESYIDEKLEEEIISDDEVDEEINEDNLVGDLKWDSQVFDFDENNYSGIQNKLLMMIRQL